MFRVGASDIFVYIVILLKRNFGRQSIGLKIIIAMQNMTKTIEIIKD